MKNYVSLFALVFLFSGISIANPNPDKDKALDAIHGFYKAMSTFEYDKVGNYCTSDFGCIDNAVYYKTLDEFVALVKTFEGAEMKYDIKVEEARMESKSGLIIVTFDVDIKMGEEKMRKFN